MVVCARQLHGRLICASAFGPLLLPAIPTTAQNAVADARQHCGRETETERASSHRQTCGAQHPHAAGPPTCADSRTRRPTCSGCRVLGESPLAPVACGQRDELSVHLRMGRMRIWQRGCSTSAGVRYLRRHHHRHTRRTALAATWRSHLSRPPIAVSGERREGVRSGGCARRPLLASRRSVGAAAPESS